ncbi:hypothetical protein BDA96_08G071000 [Sorghum bicolor]|uniref:Uncharacterized protein n=1 Tax=Sorghum bicolor TaxID=4558 RepID=A0A921QGH9_SORBI|nr:hypothetical protein BDA96_08G071000 [Sorghum bicolor]
MGAVVHDVLVSSDTTWMQPVCSSDLSCVQLQQPLIIKPPRLCEFPACLSLLVPV